MKNSPGCDVDCQQLSQELGNSETDGTVTSSSVCAGPAFNDLVTQAFNGKSPLPAAFDPYADDFSFLQGVTSTPML